jgi:hypothetical protein
MCALMCFKLATVVKVMMAMRDQELDLPNAVRGFEHLEKKSYCVKQANGFELVQGLEFGADHPGLDGEGNDAQQVIAGYTEESCARDQ